MEYCSGFLDHSPVIAKDFSSRGDNTPLAMQAAEQFDADKSKGWDAFEMPCLLTVRTRIDPGSLARVSNVFTQRGLIPAFLSCRRADPFLLIDVQLMPEDSTPDDVLLERLRALVCVDRVEYGGALAGHRTA